MKALPRSMVDRLRGRAGVERRARWLRHHPLCVHCMKAGRVTEATEVDHIIALANGGKDNESNLQSLCAECHKAKTADDMGYTQRVQVGLDGWPVE